VNISEIRERESKATKGPWVIAVDSEGVIVDHQLKRSYYFVPEHLLVDRSVDIDDQATYDAELVAYGRQDIRDLLDAVDRAREIIRCMIVDHDLSRTIAVQSKLDAEQFLADTSAKTEVG